MKASNDAHEAGTTAAAMKAIALFAVQEHALIKLDGRLGHESRCAISRTAARRVLAVIGARSRVSELEHWFPTGDAVMLMKAVVAMPTDIFRGVERGQRADALIDYVERFLNPLLVPG